MLKRHDTDAVDSGDPKRVRVTHKQSDKRADSEKTNETVAKRAKLSDSQSSSSSSHFLKSETAPNTYDSSGEIDDPLTRESVAKNARVGADMDVGAIEVFTNAKRWKLAAHWAAGETLHRLRVDVHLSLRQSPKPQNSRASGTSECTM